MKRIGLSRAVYTLLLLYEVLKALILGREALAAGGPITSRAAFDYMALAAMCLVPAMYFMLIASERSFFFCLPLLAIAKGCSLLSLLLLAARLAYSLAPAIPQVSDFAFVICAIIACAAGEVASLAFCLWRRRKICG